MNDLKQFISQKDNEILQYVFDMYADQSVHDFTKENIDEWDVVMVSTEMNKQHFRIGSDFEIFL